MRAERLARMQEMGLVNKNARLCHVSRIFPLGIRSRSNLVPTLLEVAGTEHPSKKDVALAPITGKSLAPLLAGTTEAVRSETGWIGWELFGNRAIRQGDWKLLYLLKQAGGKGDWELFNLRQDPGETRDLSAENPNKRKALLELWEQYVKSNGVILTGVILTGDGPFTKRKP